MKFLAAFASVLCVLSYASADVPVLFFGTSLPYKVPALKSIASEEFTNLLQSQISKETITVVFVEPKLQTEDLTCKVKGVTCFENLNGFKQKSYLPRVASPISGIYDLQETVFLKPDEVLGGAAQGKTIIINFEPVSDKADYVEHDKIIGDIYRELAKKYSSIVVVYTGRQPDEAKVRHTRAAESRAVEWNIVGDPNFAIAAEKVTKQVGDSPVVESTVQTVKSTLDGNNLNVELTYASADAFTLNFKMNLGNWELIGAEANSKKISKYPKHLYAADYFSMRCGETLDFHSFEDKTTYSIHNSQFLPKFTAGEPGTVPQFNIWKIVHCNGYWSPGILAGIFVVFLLFFIMYIGLYWIMGVNTMDRFEDPKGKTITINAQE